jgi:uncharacterized protein DUF1579
MKIEHKPPAEVEKLSYFVGDWTTEGRIQPGPWGEGGKFSWTESTKWMAGRFFVIGHWHFHMPASLGGDGEEIFIMGYDPPAAAYTFDAFSSQGLHQVSKGRLEGDTWTWLSEGMQAGRPVQQRMTMQVLSPTSYKLKFEISTDGSNWALFMQGTATKQ